ncbi:MAG: methyltransferase family protein [Paracoccus sp. (in: a-proteobacteria)]|uniref:methyltransferase family protein n=1 Tax=Paracoccus sp. TaxID=267 RepID=UPI00391B9A2E
MVTGFGGAALAVLSGYLLLFLWGGTLAARAAGRPIWLFGRARGPDRWAARGFRAAFALPFLGALLWGIWPSLQELDPFRIEEGAMARGLTGIFLAGLGAMLAFAAQMSMGSSWRVGVAEGATGTLVPGGLYRFSRNPTFMGQCLLLVGVALAVPAVPAILAPLLFFWAASTQVRSEEAELTRALGAEYRRYLETVPRWIGPDRRNVR